jgi:hypothetical protein
MRGEIWKTLVREYTVYDVPDDMAACIDCDVVRCPDGKYETCPVVSLNSSNVCSESASPSSGPFVH